MGCQTTRMLTQTTQTSHRNVEKQIDTVTQVVTDSSMLQLWLECDSLGQVKVSRLAQTNSILQSTIFKLQNNLLELESMSQTIYRDRVHTIYDTTTKIQMIKVPIPGAERIQRGALWWWQSILLWIGGLYLLRITIKIAINWQSLTFKTLFKLL